MSLETELELAKVVMTIAAEERGREVARQVLAEQPTFEPFAAFQRLDRNNQGYLTSIDIRAFVRYQLICNLCLVQPAWQLMLRFAAR